MLEIFQEILDEDKTNSILEPELQMLDFFLTLGI